MKGTIISSEEFATSRVSFNPVDRAELPPGVDPHLRVNFIIGDESGAHGEKTTVWTPDFAIEVGEYLVRHAKRLKSGLVLPDEAATTNGHP